LSLVSFEIPKQVRNDTLSFVMLNLVLNLIQYRFSISFNAFVLIPSLITLSRWRGRVRVGGVYIDRQNLEGG